MFKKQDTSGYAQVLDKITRKTLVYGAKTLMTEFRLTHGAMLPKHHGIRAVLPLHALSCLAGSAHPPGEGPAA